MPLPPVSAYTDSAGRAVGDEPDSVLRPLLAGGVRGAAALRPLTEVVLAALADGAARRAGPLPRGGPRAVAEAVAGVLGASGDGALPERGTGAAEALEVLVRTVAEGAADPADPLCAAHLHCPPLAVAVAADLAASALNPSLDSWDQAPAASELERHTCGALARLVYEGRGADAGGGAGVGTGAGGATSDGADAGAGAGSDAGSGADALITTGGTESNQLALLLARERLGRELRVVCGENAHHSVARAAWLLGLPEPLRVPAPGGVLAAAELRAVLAALGPGARVLVVATAGTTDAGAVDPLPEVADAAREFGARLHVDAAYGGMLLFSGRLRGRLAGLERADSVTVDLHKLGWQPVAAGLFVVPDGRELAPLQHRADYLNAGDDSEAGLPDLLGRSLRTTRRPDVLKVAVTLRALGRRGMAELVERTCAAAEALAGLVAEDPELELYGAPELTTVLFRPAGAGADEVAEVRRRLLAQGRAVLGRAEPDGGRWLKATLLNPCAEHGDLAALLKQVHEAVAESAGPPSPAAPMPPSSPAPSGTPASPAPPTPPVPSARTVPPGAGAPGSPASPGPPGPRAAASRSASRGDRPGTTSTTGTTSTARSDPS